MSFLDKLMFWKQQEEIVAKIKKEEFVPKTITEVPTKFDSAFYPEPISCEVCNEVIEGKLKIIDDKKMHKRCYKKVKKAAYNELVT